MKEKKYLPLGTVVLLKKAKKKLMIIGFLPKNIIGEKKTFDYLGCLYPEGVLSSSKNFVFNHDQIAEIIIMGQKNEDVDKFLNLLDSAIKVKENN